jgi:hypothetical protein
MDKAKIAMLRPEIEAALVAVGTKHNVAIHLGSGSFSPSNVVFKLELAEKDAATGVAMTREAEALVKNSELYLGVKVALNQPFDFHGEKWEAVGLLTKSYKNPLLAKKISTGQIYKLPPIAVNPKWKPLPFFRSRSRFDD